MKKFLLLTSCLMIAANTFASASFTLTSLNLKADHKIANAQMYDSEGCEGKNISPELTWHNAPANTKSFAVTFYDLDAPTGNGWWHWVVFNLPANTNHLEPDAGDPDTNMLPKEAIQIQNDFGTSGYGGPCPPVGDKAHRYVITVYALKKKLTLDKTASGTEVNEAIRQSKITKDSITVTSQRYN